MSGGTVMSSAAVAAAVLEANQKHGLGTPFGVGDFCVDPGQCPRCGSQACKAFLREKNLVECVNCGHVRRETVW